MWGGAGGGIGNCVRLFISFSGMSKCTVNQHSGEIKMKRRVCLHGLSPQPDYKGGDFLSETTTIIRELVMFFAICSASPLACRRPFLVPKEKKNMSSELSHVIPGSGEAELVTVPSLELMPPPPTELI